MKATSNTTYSLFEKPLEKKGHMADIKKALGDSIKLGSKIYPEFVMNPAAGALSEIFRNPREAKNWSRNETRGVTHGILQELHPYGDKDKLIFVQVYHVNYLNDLKGRPFWYISENYVKEIPEDKRIKTVIETLRNCYYIIFSTYDTFIIGRYGDLPIDTCRLTYRSKKNRKDKIIVSDLSKAKYTYCESIDKLKETLKKIIQ